MPTKTVAKTLRVPVSEEILLEEHSTALQQFCKKWYQREAEYQGYRIVSEVIVALPADSNNTVAVQAWVQWFEEDVTELASMPMSVQKMDDWELLAASCKDEFQASFRRQGYRLEGDVVIVKVGESVTGRLHLSVSGRVRRTDLVENT